MSSQDTWDKVMALGVKDDRHRGVANTLTQDDLNTVLGTLEFFGGNTRQAVFDLQVARYRVFDFLAIAVQGRIGYGDATKVLIYSFLKVDGDVTKWIEDLQTTDYDMDKSYEEVEI